MWIKLLQVTDPLVRYLNQPLGQAEKSAVWNPSRFWYLYKINLLEACWLKDAANKGQKAC